MPASVVDAGGVDASSMMLLEVVVDVGEVELTMLLLVVLVVAVVGSAVVELVGALVVVGIEAVVELVGALVVVGIEAVVVALLVELPPALDVVPCNFNTSRSSKVPRKTSRKATNTHTVAADKVSNAYIHRTRNTHQSKAGVSNNDGCLFHQQRTVVATIGWLCIAP